MGKGQFFLMIDKGSWRTLPGCGAWWRNQAEIVNRPLSMID
jgi:hypothetical protein